MSYRSDVAANSNSVSTQKIMFKKHYGVWLFVFSVAANMLLLAMPLYLAQIYDRVIPSSSFETLIYLTVLIVFCLGLFGLMETLRNKLAQRFSAHYELVAAPAILERSLSSRKISAHEQSGLLTDVSNVRQVLSSRAYIGLFDLPFAPLFLALLFVVHPLLGWIATGGMGVLIAIALANGVLADKIQENSRNGYAGAQSKSREILGHLDDVRAMGMGRALFSRWFTANLSAMDSADKASSINGTFFGLVRFSRQTLQVAILGSGAYLVLTGGMSAGLIFATSILSGRALLPIEHLIGSWRQISSARSAHKRVSSALTPLNEAKQKPDHQITLPKLTGRIKADKIGYIPEGASEDRALLSEISFEAVPGQVLAIIGPSGAGKTTLMRVLASSMPMTSGKLFYDGFELDQWSIDQLGPAIGYSGQQSDFFAGTIAENIARFDPTASDEEVIQAAQLAGAHEFIGQFADGYNTPIGEKQVRLSGGQRQRVALARAFFRDPAILLLDEPNAHLDQVGEQALVKAIRLAKSRGKTIVFVTQRKSLLNCADQVMVLQAGKVKQIGPQNSDQGNSVNTRKPQSEGIAAKLRNGSQVFTLPTHRRDATGRGHVSSKSDGSI